MAEDLTSPASTEWARLTPGPSVTDSLLTQVIEQAAVAAAAAAAAEAAAEAALAGVDAAAQSALLAEQAAASAAAAAATAALQAIAAAASAAAAAAAAAAISESGTTVSISEDGGVQSVITAIDVRDGLNLTVVGSVGQVAVDPTDLNSEIAAREAADIVLQDNIDDLAPPANYAFDLVPTVLPTISPVLWLEATAVHSGLADNDPVGTWDDLSGNGRDLSSFAADTTRPTFLSDPDGDGIPVVRFDGVNDGIKKTGLTAYTGEDFTGFAVFRSAVRTATNARLAAWKEGTQTDVGSKNQHLAIGGTSGPFVVRGHQGGSAADRSAVAVPIGGTDAQTSCFMWRVVAWRWSTVLGVYVLSIWDNGDQAAFAPLSANAFGYDSVSLGARIGDAETSFDSATFQQVDVRAFGYCQSALRDDQIREVLRYLTLKFKVGTVG